MIKISVIMLTYNREQLVGRMIECILSQTFTNFEFIIIDNGSTDTSGLIADGYATKDSRIKVIHKERGNIGSGRNTGLDAATGEWIAFIDDDDTCTPDYLQFLYELANENNADIAICGATWANINELRIMTAEEAVETLLWRKRYNVAFPTKMFRHEQFEQSRFLNTGKYDDIYLMPKMLANANIIAYHGLPKYHFTRHENNNSAWTQNYKLITPDVLTEYLNVYRERTVWLSNIFPNSIDKWKYFEWSFMLSMADKVTVFKLSDCYTICKNILVELTSHKAEFINSGYPLDFEIEWMEKLV